MRLLPTDPVRRGRAKLALLGLFFSLPLLLSWAAWRWRWAPGDTGNYGELIAPRPVTDAAFVGPDGRDRRLSALRGKWLLVQLDAPACGDACERKLYFMRQLRLALGAERDRVERVWLLTAQGEPSAALQGAIAGTRIWRLQDEAARAAFPAAARAEDHIYLVDPQGTLMMRFPRDADPSKMLKDLKRLLKYSTIGALERPASGGSPRSA